MVKGDHEDGYGGNQNIRFNTARKKEPEIVHSVTLKLSYQSHLSDSQCPGVNKEGFGGNQHIQCNTADYIGLYKFLWLFLAGKVYISIYGQTLLSSHPI